MKEYTAILTKSQTIAQNIHKLTFDVGEEVKVRCGQFVNVSVGDGAHLLRRPIAICKAEKNLITICFQIKGEGTTLLSQKKVGEKISVLLPLGNGFFSTPKEKKIAIVGGGVGIFPMISVVKEYNTCKDIYAYMGFRNKDAICEENEFFSCKKFTIATDDGSVGFNGNSVQAFLKDLDSISPDVVFSCGPLPMLRALKTALKEKNISLYVSLEERMGCGIGACLVCVCEKTDGKHARVCKDGPVFNAMEVNL